MDIRVFIYRSDNAVKNHWHSIVKNRSFTQDLVIMNAPTLDASDSLLSCTPSQSSGLVGIQPVRLFDTPKAVSDVKFLLFRGECCVEVERVLC